MNLDELIDSLKPRTEKERRKLHDVLQCVGVHDTCEYREVRVPRYAMGVVYEGDLYTTDVLRGGQQVEVYEESYKRLAACMLDTYGRYWYYMRYDDTAYDDTLEVFVAVHDATEAHFLYRQDGISPAEYFSPSVCSVRFPHICFNEGAYMSLRMRPVPLTSPEECYDELLAHNPIL